MDSLFFCNGLARIFTEEVFHSATIISEPAEFEKTDTVKKKKTTEEQNILSLLDKTYPSGKIG